MRSRRLSRDFLIQMAQANELTLEQEKVFIARFAEDISYEDLSKRLNTSKDACLKRMSEVYKKFNISGDTRGKEIKLRVILLRKSCMSQDADSPELQSIERLQTDIDDLKEQVGSLTNHCQWPPFPVAKDNPKDWIDVLLHEAEHGKAETIQPLLEELAAQLPHMIRVVAAQSARTEQEITLDILHKIALVLQVVSNGRAIL